MEGNQTQRKLNQKIKKQTNKVFNIKVFQLAIKLKISFLDGWPIFFILSFKSFFVLSYVFSTCVPYSRITHSGMDRWFIPNSPSRLAKRTPVFFRNYLAQCQGMNHGGFFFLLLAVNLKRFCDPALAN